VDAWAQLAAKVHRIGSLNSGPKPPPDQLEIFPTAMRELGYVVGRDFVLERRFGDNHIDALPRLAAELVALNVDVIVTAGTLAPLAAKRATAVIPIVMIAAGDPVGSGLFASLAHPGGNVTGTSLNSPELASKRLQLLAEIVPGAATIAVLWNSANPYSALVLKQTEVAAIAAGIRITSLPVRTPADIARALISAREHAQALVVVEDPLTLGEQKPIIGFAAHSRLPAMYGLHEFVHAGGLISYGADLVELSRRSAVYVDKILKGAKPSDLPVEEPTKFRLSINATAASALGLTLSQSLLLRADEVMR
jgi:putative ABC transport system substrate-binding protein